MDDQVQHPGSGDVTQVCFNWSPVIVTSEHRHMNLLSHLFTFPVLINSSVSSALRDLPSQTPPFPLSFALHSSSPYSSNLISTSISFSLTSIPLPLSFHFILSLLLMRFYFYLPFFLFVFSSYSTSL